ncbi:MAG: hypothetical protein JXA42_19160 [Anaerolineales bacterium]|nr:hypothetical protein [Anaerolineales bacterium]
MNDNDLIAGDAQDNDLFFEGMGPLEPKLIGELRSLTDDLASMLFPVSPSPEFIRQLGTDLAAAAVPGEVTIGKPSRKKLVLGAVLSGSLVSAAGVLLVLVMRRNRSSPVVAG